MCLKIISGIAIEATHLNILVIILCSLLLNFDTFQPFPLQFQCRFDRILNLPFDDNQL